MNPCLDVLRRMIRLPDYVEGSCIVGVVEEDLDIRDLESIPEGVYEEIAETVRVFLRNYLDLPGDILSSIEVVVDRIDVDCDSEHCTFVSRVRIKTPDGETIAYVEVDSHAVYHKDEGSAHVYESYVYMSKENAQALYEYLLLKRAARRKR